MFYKKEGHTFTSMPPLYTPLYIFYVTLIYKAIVYL